MASTRLYEEGYKRFESGLGDRPNADPKFRAQLAEFKLKSRASPEDAQSAAKSIGGEAGQKYGERKVGDVKIQKKWVDNIMGNIQNFIVAGNIAMKGAPETVGMAWFAVSLTLTAISNNYALYGIFGAGLTDITELMVIIPHYDRLYDERQKPGFQASPVVKQLFNDTIEAYAAILDFSFKVKRHVGEGGWRRIGHGLKDFFGAEGAKFQGRLDTIAKWKAKVIEHSQAAFQQRAFEKFGDVQQVVDVVRDRVQDIQKMQSEMLEYQQAILESQQEQAQALAEIKENVKAKSPWDRAMQDFETMQKKLDPLASSEGELLDVLDKKHPGTCEWIETLSQYTAWNNGEGEGLLCIKGNTGVGKSVLVASIVDKLRTQHSTSNTIVKFISCSTARSEQSREPTVHRKPKIIRTLMYVLYELVTESEDDLSLLEKCNDVFKNSKKKKSGMQMDKGAGSAPREDDAPDFAEAICKMLDIQGRNAIFVVDGVGYLSQQDQKALFNGIKEAAAATPGGHRAQFLIGARSDSEFANDAFNGNVNVDVSSHNRDDMKLVLESQLEGFPRWSLQERQDASKKILEQAGSQFDYIKAVAVPYLSQPFKSLSEHLTHLPRGLEDTYTRELQTMPTNYADLLRTAVRWCAYSPINPRVREIIEAYEGTYTADYEGSDLDSAQATEQYDHNASELDIKQIQAVSRSFLATQRLPDGDIAVYLQDRQQIVQYCERSAQQQAHADDHEAHAAVCDRCKADIHSDVTLGFTPKVLHLELVLTFLRHLNNPLYKRRFGLSSGRGGAASDKASADDEGYASASASALAAGDKEGSPESPKSDNSEEGKEADAAPAEDTATAPMEDSAAAPEKDTAVEESTVEDDGPTQESNASTELPKTSEDEANKNEDDDEEDDPYDSEASRDSEDSDGDEGDDDNDSPPPSQPTAKVDVNGAPLRYESICWPFHLRRAEALWSKEERETSQVWKDLSDSIMQELDKFYADAEAFENWQKQLMTQYASDRAPFLAELRKPLHVAAFIGTTSWAEHLLQRGADPNEISGERNAVQASSLTAYDVHLLELLLDHGGDPHVGSDEILPAMHSWLLKKPTSEVVQIFKNHGGQFDCKDMEGWTPIHCIAWDAMDGQALKTAMETDDPSKKPNINAPNQWQYTPLHQLLWRTQPPLELLKEFLAQGADVLAEDEESQQPLAIASNYGDVDVMQILIDHHPDVNDLDQNENNALHFATWSDKVESIKKLLETDINVSQRNKNGNVPLHWAAWKGNKAVVELLISKGADPNEADGHSRTPLFFAAKGKDQATVEFILDELERRNIGIQAINQVTQSQRSPLRQAADHGFTNVVSRLLAMLKASDDPEAQKELKGRPDNKQQMISNEFILTERVQTPLHRAARRGEVDCVKLLLQYGAEISLVDAKGKTALALASEQWLSTESAKYEDTVLQLINADPQAALDVIDLPSVAAANGSTAVLRRLHGLKADLNRRDTFGWTPLAHAKNSKRSDAEFFLKHETSWGGDLPSRWVDQDNAPTFSDDGRVVQWKGGERLVVVSDKPLPHGVDRFYYEVALEAPETGEGKKNPEVAIGFATHGASFHRFPGWKPRKHAPSARAYAYHGDDGNFYNGTSNYHIYTEEPYGPGDTIGCGVDLESGTVFWTKNGKELNSKLTGIRGRVFPVIGLKDAVKLSTNFGREKFMRNTRAEAQAAETAPEVSEAAKEQPDGADATSGAEQTP